MKYTTGVLLMILLSYCSSSKNYPSFNDTYDRVFIFTLSRSSDDVRIVKEGPSTMATRDPSNRNVFKNSILEIVENSNLNLKYTDYIENISKDQIHIKSNLISAKWTFKATSATMLAEIEYEVNGQIYNITGQFKNWSGGTKEKVLQKAIMNANYQIIEKLINLN